MNNKYIEITDENFEKEVLQAAQPAVIDFYADWCGPCKMIERVFENILDEYEGKIRFGKVNVDDQKKLAIQHQVANIPTVLFYKDGEQVDRVTGLIDEAQLKERLDRLI
ncbi:MAG: thioredoxin [Clostridiales Family XIII bacterium]|nr:thioredoxin [Clostridiales Family XIII bacterium]